jgi:hypothetical protein
MAMVRWEAAALVGGEMDMDEREKEVFINVIRPTSWQDIAKFPTQIPKSNIDSMIYRESLGKIMIGKHGDGYCLLTCDHDLGSRKYEGILRRTSSNLSFLTEIISDVVVKRVLQYHLAQGKIDRTTPERELCSLQLVRTTVEDILHRSGVQLAVEDAKNEQFALSSLVNRLSVRAYANSRGR